MFVPGNENYLTNFVNKYYMKNAEVVASIQFWIPYLNPLYLENEGRQNLLLLIKLHLFSNYYIDEINFFVFLYPVWIENYLGNLRFSVAWVRKMLKYRVLQFSSPFIL